LSLNQRGRWVQYFYTKRSSLTYSFKHLNNEERFHFSDALFSHLVGSRWGLLWWQIRCVHGRRSVGCASHGSKSEILAKLADDVGFAR
jgi:hypothetical protein